MPMVPPPPPLHKVRKKRAFGWKDWVVQVGVYFLIAGVLVGIGMDIYEWFVERYAKYTATKRLNRKPSARAYNASPTDAVLNPKDGLTYVRIPAGSFEFGCSVGDNKCYYDENRFWP